MTLQGVVAVPTLPGDEPRVSRRASWIYALPDPWIETAAVLGRDPTVAAALDEVADRVVIVEGRFDRATPPRIDLLYVAESRISVGLDSLADLVRRLARDAIVCVEAGPADEAIVRAIEAAGRRVSAPVELRVREVHAATRAVAPTGDADLLDWAVAGRAPAPHAARFAASPRAWLRRRLRPGRTRMTDRTMHFRLLDGRTEGVAAEAAPGPPAYLSRAASEFGIALDRWRWALSTGGEYVSQKLVWYLAPPDSAEPTLIVKQPRAADFNMRLVREFEALRTVRRLDLGPSTVVPEARFLGWHAGRALLGEELVAGRDVHDVIRPGHEDPTLDAVVSWLTTQAAGTRSEAVPGAYGDTIRELVGRCDQAYGLTAGEREALVSSADRLEERRLRLPLVFGHGDPGAWNIVATEDGKIAPLDWEAADPAWPPAWDLIYFLRSYAAASPRFGSTRTALRHLVQGSGVTPFLGRAVAHYVAALDLPLDAVADLYHTCWLHRAVKQAARLPRGRRKRAHFIRLLRAGIHARRIALVDATLDAIAAS